MFGFKKIDLNKMPIKKIVIIGQFAVILFMVRSCSLQDLTIDKNGLQVKMYENKVNEFSQTVNKLGQKLYTQDQVITERNKELEKEMLKSSNLSKINQQIKFEAETKVANIMADYSGNNGTEVVFVHDTIIKPNGDTAIIKGVPIGTKFKADTSEWYNIAGSLQEKGVKFDSISFKSDYDINIGLKKQKGYKGWLLGKKDPKVEIVNKNPYTNINVMKNITFEDNKWWQNGWLKFGAGVLLGGFIMGGIR